MARPKEGKDKGFLSGHQTAVAAPGAFSSTPASVGQGGDSVSVPYIPTSALNRVYETGAAGFPSEEFFSPEEKRIGQLEEELEQVRAAGQALAADGTITVQGFQLTPTGLIAPEEFSEQAWEQIGHLLFKLEGALQWLIGDWLAYGNDIKWGDGPAFAEKFGRDYGTVRNYASLSRQIPLSFRNDKLTYTHHVVAANAKLESEQLEYAFAGAIHFGFSVSEFRKWIKLDMPETGLPKEPPPPSRSALPLPTGDAPDIGLVARDVQKFLQRDPSTFKKADREAAQEHANRLYKLADAVKKHAGIDQ